MGNITMKDIADKLGLSINSISLVLNDRSGVGDETRSLVLKTAEEMGYLEQTSKYRKTYSGKNLCVLIQRIYFRDMHFYAKILLGIEQEAKKNKYDILMSVVDDDEIPSCIQNKKVSGVIVVGKIETEYLKRVKQYKIPVILVDTASMIDETDSVMTDNLLGGFKAVCYLIEKGYHRIGFFGDLDYTVSVRDRFYGYQEAIKCLPGLGGYSETYEYIKEYSVLCDIEEHILNNDLERITARIQSVRQMPEVFFCSNDNAAILICNALKTLGYRIPEDIGVMGFDDLDLCNMVIPKLTTIQVNKELMGRRAIQLFLWRIANKKDPAEKIMMGIEVVERNSIT